MNRAPTMCITCGKHFEPRTFPGGKPKAHCSDKCRHQRQAEFTALGEHAISVGVYTVADAKRALEAKRARKAGAS